MLKMFTNPSYISAYLSYFHWGLFLGFVFFLLFLAFVTFYNRALCKRCTSSATLSGKTVIITGASSGIGNEAAKVFASKGAKVIMACRNLTRAKKAADAIRNITGNVNVHVKLLDTSLLSSVRAFGKDILETENRLDVLVLNAGVVGATQRVVTSEGLETTMATNYFGHFLLVNLLLGLLRKSSPSRIVITAAQAHSSVSKIDPKDLNFDKVYNYGPLKAYALSKLCTVLMTRYLAAYFQEKGVTVNCFCPGLVATELYEKSTDFIYGTFYKWLVPIAGRRPVDGAQTLIYLAVAEEVKDMTGAYFVDCQARKSSKVAEDAGLIKVLWEKSEDMVHLTEEERKLRYK